MTPRDWLAVTIGAKRAGWAKRGMRPRRYVREVPVGLYGAVSLRDGTHHATSGIAHEWDLAKKAIAS